jgi:hypothetical protein
MVNIQLNQNSPTASFTWTPASQVGISGAVPGFGPLINTALTATSASVQGILDYQVSSTLDGCAASKTIRVTVTNGNFRESICL